MFSLEWMISVMCYFHLSSSAYTSLAYTNTNTKTYTNSNLSSVLITSESRSIHFPSSTVRDSSTSLCPFVPPSQKPIPSLSVDRRIFHSTLFLSSPKSHFLPLQKSEGDFKGETIVFNRETSTNFNFRIQTTRLMPTDSQFLSPQRSEGDYEGDTILFNGEMSTNVDHIIEATRLLSSETHFLSLQKSEEDFEGETILLNQETPTDFSFRARAALTKVVLVHSYPASATQTTLLGTQTIGRTLLDTQMKDRALIGKGHYFSNGAVDSERSVVSSECEKGSNSDLMLPSLISTRHAIVGLEDDFQDRPNTDCHSTLHSPQLPIGIHWTLSETTQDIQSTHIDQSYPILSTMPCFSREIPSPFQLSQIPIRTLSEPTQYIQSTHTDQSTFQSSRIPIRTFLETPQYIQSTHTDQSTFQSSRIPIIIHQTHSDDIQNTHTIHPPRQTFIPTSPSSPERRARIIPTRPLPRLTSSKDAPGASCKGAPDTHKFISCVVPSVSQIYKTREKSRVLMQNTRNHTKMLMTRPYLHFPEPRTRLISAPADLYNKENGESYERFGGRRFEGSDSCAFVSKANVRNCTRLVSKIPLFATKPPDVFPEPSTKVLTPGKNPPSDACGNYVLLSLIISNSAMQASHLVVTTSFIPVLHPDPRTDITGGETLVNNKYSGSVSLTLESSLRSFPEVNLRRSSSLSMPMTASVSQSFVSARLC